MDLQRSSWVLELQQVYVLLSSFVPLIMLRDPCAFISISHNAVVVSCNMDNSIWIKNTTQHNPGMNMFIPYLYIIFGVKFAYFQMPYF